MEGPDCTTMWTWLLHLEFPKEEILFIRPCVDHTFENADQLLVFTMNNGGVGRRTCLTEACVALLDDPTPSCHPPGLKPGHLGVNPSLRGQNVIK